MPCSSSSEGEAAVASWAVPRTPVIASRNSVAPVLRARIENRLIVFIRQTLPRNCYRRITSISVVCHLPRGNAAAGTQFNYALMPQVSHPARREARGLQDFRLRSLNAGAQRVLFLRVPLRPCVKIGLDLWVAALPRCGIICLMVQDNLTGLGILIVEDELLLRRTLTAQLRSEERRVGKE